MLLFFVKCLDKTQKEAAVLILTLHQFHWEPGMEQKHIQSEDFSSQYMSHKSEMISLKFQMNNFVRN